MFSCTFIDFQPFISRKNPSDCSVVIKRVPGVFIVISHSGLQKTYRSSVAFFPSSLEFKMKARRDVYLLL